jgi:hypothetical protein
MSWKISLCKEWWHCWIINQMKNRNTSSKTENDMKLMNNYFTSIGEVRKHNIWQNCIICHIKLWFLETINPHKY